MLQATSCTIELQGVFSFEIFDGECIWLAESYDKYFVVDHNANSYMYIVSQCEALILVDFS
mgnify:CR=1 FL=1